MPNAIKVLRGALDPLLPFPCQFLGFQGDLISASPQFLKYSLWVLVERGPCKDEAVARSTTCGEDLDGNRLEMEGQPAALESSDGAALCWEDACSHPFPFRLAL